MKLFELTGIHHQREKDMIQLLKDIKGEGSKFKIAGEGVFAQVLSHEDGTIYKFWAKDSAYEKFIEFVQKNQDNKHLPKLKSKIKELSSFFKKPEDFPDKVKYIKMEKLEPITDDTKIIDTKNLYVTDVAVNIIDCIQSGVEEVKTLSHLFSLLIKDEEGAYNTHQPSHIPALKESSIKVIKELFETFLKMLKYPGMIDLHFDLHSGNFMRRGTEIVIIDPVMSDEDAVFNKKLMTKIKYFHYQELIDHEHKNKENKVLQK